MMMQTQKQVLLWDQKKPEDNYLLVYTCICVLYHLFIDGCLVKLELVTRLPLQSAHSDFEHKPNECLQDKG